MGEKVHVAKIDFIFLVQFNKSLTQGPATFLLPVQLFNGKACISSQERKYSPNITGDYVNLIQWASTCNKSLDLPTNKHVPLDHQTK